MDAPQYLWGLLERELRRSHRELLSKVATKHNLSLEDLERDFLPSTIEFVPNKKVAITIRKKLAPSPPAPEESRCHARVWNRGKGGQCTRKCADASEYCSQHKDQRKHGDMREKPPRHMYPAQKRTLYV